MADENKLSRRNALRSGAAWAMLPSLLSLTSARAANEEAYEDGKLADGPPAAIAKDSFTIVVLPDTQNYCEAYPEHFQAQTQWIADQQQARNIACVLHLGDITNRNSNEQWELAVAALQTLDGKVPYFLVPGNHDYSLGGRCLDRTTKLNDYFSVAKFRERPTFGGTYDKEPDKLENSYHLFSAGGREFLVIGLEFGPRKDVVRWANEVAAKYKDRAAILITHAYMYSDDTRYDFKQFATKQLANPHVYGIAKSTADDICDGRELWDGLVNRHENFILTLNGHVLNDGLGRLTGTTPSGRAVHQLLVNFQMRPEGGDGWLRLLEFRPDGKTVVVQDYSPTRNQRNESAQNQFTLTLAAVGKV